MSVPSCYDCKHHQRDSDEHVHGSCTKFLKDAISPHYWACGTATYPMGVEEARSGPCGKSGQAFERRPTIWQELRAFLSQSGS